MSGRETTKARSISRRSSAKGEPVLNIPRYEKVRSISKSIKRMLFSLFIFKMLYVEVDDCLLLTLFMLFMLFSSLFSSSIELLFELFEFLSSFESTSSSLI